MATIIIADDDPVVRQFAIELLRDCDHAVLQAEDGREAVRLVEAMPIDLLVVDMLMPEMDGLETILALRQSHPSLKMLAISGGGQIGIRPLLDMAKTFGVHATLQKPLSISAFRTAIEHLLADAECTKLQAPGQGALRVSSDATRL